MHLSALRCLRNVGIRLHINGDYIPEQDGQYQYDVTLRRIRETIVAGEKE
jgi:hypothetical protein